MLICESRCISVHTTSIQPLLDVRNRTQDIAECALPTTEKAAANALVWICPSEVAIAGDVIVHPFEHRLNRVCSWAEWWCVQEHTTLPLDRFMQLVERAVASAAPVQACIVNDHHRVWLTLCRVSDVWQDICPALTSSTWRVSSDRRDSMAWQ